MATMGDSPLQTYDTALIEAYRSHTDRGVRDYIQHKRTRKDTCVSADNSVSPSHAQTRTHAGMTEAGFPSRRTNVGHDCGYSRVTQDDGSTCFLLLPQSVSLTLPLASS